MMVERRVRGLPSLEEAKAERRRAIVFGKVRLRAMPPQFWLLTATVIAAFGVIYWRVAQGKLEGQKSAVMAKQRAIAQTLGPKILPFRDRIEAWVAELAGSYPGDFLAQGLPLEKIEKSSGIYLRLRLENAKDGKSVRKAAQRSLHDGFTSCLFVKNSTADPSQGPSCRTPADCEAGKLCNEWKVCAAAPEPYNMRLAYRALRVLSTEWSDELHATTNDLTVAAYDRDLDAVTRNDVPVAINLLSRARYFTLVLDEDPADSGRDPGSGGIAPNDADAGLDETEEERVQRADHFARIGIWDLKSGEALFRLRAEAAGRFVPVGERVVSAGATVAAQQRQANSCALALEIKRAFAGRDRRQLRRAKVHDLRRARARPEHPRSRPPVAAAAGGFDPEPRARLHVEQAFSGNLARVEQVATGCAGAAAHQPERRSAPAFAQNRHAYRAQELELAYDAVAAAKPPAPAGAATNSEMDDAHGKS